MRTARLTVLLLALAACASTPQQREMQYAKAIVAANNATATALDFDIITPEQGEAIQAVTRTATADLKRAVAGRRAGQPADVIERILDAVESALSEVARLLAAQGGS